VQLVDSNYDVVRIAEHNHRYMDCDELELTLKYTDLQIKWQSSATKIRSLWISFITRKRITPLILERRKAAIRIQRNYRARAIQRYIKILRRRAATMI
jgi:hypothetical protein